MGVALSSKKRKKLDKKSRPAPPARRDSYFKVIWFETKVGLSSTTMRIAGAREHKLGTDAKRELSHYPVRDKARRLKSTGGATDLGVVVPPRQNSNLNSRFLRRILAQTVTTKAQLFQSTLDFSP